MRIAYMGARGHIDVRRPLREIFGSAGLNMGNLLIGQGLRRLLSCESSFEIPDPNWIPEDQIDARAKDVNEAADALVVATANLINPRFDGAKWSKLVEKVNIPVIVFGLGAQSSLSYEIPQITPSLHRLLNLLSDRAACIGVRGAFTADVLERYGIKNVRVIGCPSFFAYPAGIMGTPDRFVPSDATTVGLNWHRGLAKFFPAMLDSIVNAGPGRRILYFIQDEVIGAETPIDDFEDYTGLIAKSYGLSDEQVARAGLLSVFPYDVSVWRFLLGQLSFSVGVRIHGNIVALQAGTPAFVFAYDSRTKELCETLSIPHASLKKGAEITTFWARDEVSFVEMKKSFAGNYENFVEFAHVNGLEVAKPETGDSVGGRITRRECS